METKNALLKGTVLKGSSYSYLIERILGQGSFGITYLASVKMAGALGSIDAKIKVAIKEFFMRDINGRADSTVTSGSKGGIYDEYKRKFQREAINLSKLQHEHIIKVIESFEANNTVYYVMEFMEGGSLDDYITKNQGLREADAVKLVRQIGSALSYMHSQGFLHLDLKPSNIMRKESGDVVLIDFGLSKQYNSDGNPESSTKVGAGTPGYAPIEQANYREGKGFPVTMDIYALGATMFKMLTGVRPPEASDILNEGFPFQELQSRKVSDRTIACIAKAMAPIKKDRYQSVADFLNALDSDETIVVDVEIAESQANEKTQMVEISTDEVPVVHCSKSQPVAEPKPLKEAQKSQMTGSKSPLDNSKDSSKKPKNLWVWILAPFLFIVSLIVLTVLSSRDHNDDYDIDGIEEVVGDPGDLAINLMYNAIERVEAAESFDELQTVCTETQEEIDELSKEYPDFEASEEQEMEMDSLMTQFRWAVSEKSEELGYGEVDFSAATDTLAEEEY